jgi:tRNA modification GTPase
VHNLHSDTIVALATPPGTGALAVIRVSGKDTFSIVNKIFRAKDLSKQASHTIHYGHIYDNELVIDEVLIAVFKAPSSFTKEDSVEISCHGSNYIVSRIIKLLIANGARHAKAGEFTMRAFLNGRFDLAQAEAVADLIHSDSDATHNAAINQLRGGFSKEIQNLRAQLIHFASMIELELDFAEEDVEFANRDQLKHLILDLLKVINPLAESFELGNAIKEGIPTVIVGKPNAGKSTLLNTLLNEDKAIVSDIEGTTRDVIEDQILLNGIKFRFIDTAGLRKTSDKLEAIGIERTLQKVEQASLVIYLFDINTTSSTELKEAILQWQQKEKPFILVANKVDKANQNLAESLKTELKEYESDLIFISAAHKTGIDTLKEKLVAKVGAKNFKTGNTVVTNLRHFESLTNTAKTLEKVLVGIDANITTDLLAEDIRLSLYYLGLITGEITTEDLLDNIFTKFCIGK